MCQINTEPIISQAAFLDILSKFNALRMLFEDINITVKQDDKPIDILH